MVASVLTDLTAGSQLFTVEWTDVSKPADFYAWRIYQRKTGVIPWTLIFETLVDSASYNVTSYAWANGISQDIVVVGVSQDPVDGTLTETSPTPVNVLTPVGDTKYTLVHPTDPSKTVILPIATNDSHSDENESQVIKLLDNNGEGGGRRIHVGTSFGIEVSLSVQDRTTAAGANKAAITELHRLQVPIFLRTPFGDLHRVWMEKPQFTRLAGVGTDEFYNLSLSFSQVI